MCCCENKLICTSETPRHFKIFYRKNVDTILTVSKEHMTEKVLHYDRVTPSSKDGKK